jgi:hypothetical protein
MTKKEEEEESAIQNSGAELESTFLTRCSGSRPIKN